MLFHLNHMPSCFCFFVLKQMNNMVFGKTMENVRNRFAFSLYRADDEKEKLLRAVAKPSFKHSVIFDNDLVGVLR